MASVGRKAVDVDSLKYVKDYIDGTKAGFLEISGSTVRLYTDSTKSKLLSSATLPSSGTPGDNPGTVLPSDLEELLANKTIKTRIDFDGNRTFKVGTKVLNYKELHDIHLVNPDFGFIVYGDRAYLLSYVQDDTSAMREMRFQSVIAVTDGSNISNTKVSGIYVKSTDGVNITSVNVVDINSESTSYKATAITDSNKNNVWYPSTKAVADYVDEKVVTKEDLWEHLAQMIQTEMAFVSTSHPHADAIIALIEGEDVPDTPTPDEPDPPTPTRTLQSISATYTGGDVDAGTLATELTGITVTGHYNVAPLTQAVTGWTISGTVAEGSNTFTISYGGKTTTISVTGVAVAPPEEGDTIVLTVDKRDKYITSTGAEDAYSGWSITNRVNVDGCVSIELVISDRANSRMDGQYQEWLDGDGVHISNLGTMAQIGQSTTYTVPSNAMYVRFSTLTNDIENGRIVVNKVRQ